MTVAGLEELLPRAMVSPRTKSWWLVFFVLFPLAYLGGVMLESAHESAARIPGSIDRAASIRTAEHFAASKGFEVASWPRYAVLETRDNLVAYYSAGKAPDLAMVKALAPDREVQVLFRSPDQNHEFRVYLSLTGLVTGYEFGKSTDRSRSVTSDIGAIHVQTNTTNDADDAVTIDSAKAPDEQAAENLARHIWAGNAALSKLVQLGPAKIVRNADDASRVEVVWDVSPARMEGLTLHLTTAVRDSQVVAQHILANLDKSHTTKKPRLGVVLEGLYSLFLTFATFYAMYRYARRSLQKEVSHLRTLVVAALFSISFSILSYSLGIDQLVTRVSGATFMKVRILVYVTSGITLVIMGLLVGIGYGSGEGELREAYPGKLTSLDALLAGRLFSRDVAASFFFGAAAAGWLLLAQHAISHFLASDVVASRSEALSFTFARFPRLTLILGKQYDSLLIAVAGLLLPASALLRRGVRRRRFLWLLVFALLAVLGDAAQYPTPALALLAISILAGALLLPFFAFDLLAAMVSLSALALVNEVVRLTNVVPAWTPFALWLAVLSAIAMAGAVYLALYGRGVQEEDVRPLYARNLAERMAMQAEILAAREAQLRLLPQAAPELPGLQVAACCLPARGVGGDFYDFFRLDANRVGIFVAQGGDEGLASALCIALAKGLLMHASQQSQSPTQLILGLEKSIAELLQGGSASGISFAYGVMDTRRNLLNYARIGSSPHFMIYREGAALTASSQLEREVSEPGRLKGGVTIHEGAAQARAGDFLLFVTEGVMSLRTKRFGKHDFAWLRGLVRELGKAEEPLQKSLISSLAKYRNQASEDLTVVVLRVAGSQAALQEVVA